jgi:hypothetical protein
MPVSKIKMRREASRQIAEELLRQLISGQIEVYVGYRRLYGCWCNNNSAVPELRPLFRIPGIEPDGMLSVSEDFNQQVISIAREVLPYFSREPA